MNERKLKAKCVEYDVSTDDLANGIGMSVATYYRKLANQSFTVTEIIKIANYLRLTPNDVINIFFEKLVA